MDNVTFTVDDRRMVVRTTAEDALGGQQQFTDVIEIPFALSEGVRSGAISDAQALREIRSQWNVLDAQHTAAMAGTLLSKSGTRAEIREYINSLSL